MYIPTALIFRGQPAQYAGMAKAVEGIKPDAEILTIRDASTLDEVIGRLSVSKA